MKNGCLFRWWIASCRILSNHVLLSELDGCSGLWVMDELKNDWCHSPYSNCLSQISGSLNHKAHKSAMLNRSVDSHKLNLDSQILAVPKRRAKFHQDIILCCQ